MFAAYVDNLEMAKLLVNSGAAVNITNKVSQFMLYRYIYILTCKVVNDFIMWIALFILCVGW